ncbi:hypothetical protein R6Q57_015831 [Mikania cordata]
MIPPRQQARSGVLHTSLSLVPPPDTSGSPKVQEHGSNLDQLPAAVKTGTQVKTHKAMAHVFFKILLLITIFSTHKSDAQFEDWCIADEQTPEDELQRAMVWACENGADCSKIETNQPCFEPNTIKDHASFAFNSYFQRMKAKGATCYFNSAALVTDLDPSN